jgi:hypothetical protein
MYMYNICEAGSHVSRSPIYSVAAVPCPAVSDPQGRRIAEKPEMERVKWAICGRPGEASSSRNSWKWEVWHVSSISGGEVQRPKSREAGLSAAPDKEWPGSPGYRQVNISFCR